MEMTHSSTLESMSQYCITSRWLPWNSEFLASAKTAAWSSQTQKIAEAHLRKNVRHQSISTVCHPSILGNTESLRCSIRFDVQLLASCLALLLSSDVESVQGNCTFLKTSSRFPCKSGRWKVYAQWDEDIVAKATRRPDAFTTTDSATLPLLHWGRPQLQQSLNVQF